MRLLTMLLPLLQLLLQQQLLFLLLSSTTSSKNTTVVLAFVIDVRPQQQRTQKIYNNNDNNNNIFGSGYCCCPVTRRQQSKQRQQQRQSRCTFQSLKLTDDDVVDAAESTKQQQQWINEGLLISSFSDGVVPNLKAQEFIRKGLLRALLTEEQQNTEQKLESSVIASPCNGPNIEVLNQLEQIDQALHSLQNDSTNKASTTITSNTTVRGREDVNNDHTDARTLRFLYIPTAMYALRYESNNTPGKQRQRARADGKQRRNDIVTLLHNLLDDTNIATITLDLDDDSIKQTEYTTTTSASSSNNNNVNQQYNDFPKTGKEALNDWKPHLIYVQGGNTFWLYYCIEKGNYINDLINALCNKNTFYIGSSAGAIIIGNTIETACWKGWDDPRIIPNRTSYDDWKDISGLGLIGNISFFPHYNNTEWSDLVLQRSNELKQRYPNYDICCLPDHQVCYVNGKRKTTIIV